METNTHTYEVPGMNLGHLQARIDELNKRARRIGCPEIQMTATLSCLECSWYIYDTGSRHISTVWKKQGEVPTAPFPGFTVKPTGNVREWFAVSVTGEAPKFNGWRLIGVLEPLALEDGTAENIVSAVPGYEVPQEYRDRIGECDHCHSRRQRKETFVVLHEDGTHKMVGRQCLKDFLGHQDPHSLASWAELLCELSGLCQDAGAEDWMGGGCREPNCWNLGHVLNVTSAVIRMEGWLSRGKVRQLQDEGVYGKMATADFVSHYLCPPLKQYRSQEEQAWLDSVKELMGEEEHQQRAQQAQEWAKAIEDTSSDYLYNVNLLARAGYVKGKSLGVAASIIPAYLRAVEKEVEQKVKAARPNEHIGTVGKRQEFTVTCERVVENDGNFGVTGIHKMLDQDGRQLVWFASGSAEWLKEGHTYRVKATVKGHTEYQGWKQTNVNRLTIIEEVTSESAG